MIKSPEDFIQQRGVRKETSKIQTISHNLSFFQGTIDGDVLSDGFVGVFYL